VTTPRFLLSCCLFLCLLSGPARAGDEGDGCPPQGECLIDGETAICPGGSTELCGPEGYAWYTWTRPDETVWQARCLTATQPGVYRLVVADADLCKLVCEVEVKVQESVPCEISGEPSFCSGGSTDLCAPEGLALYSWTGPEGFVSKERCIEVSVAGVYQFQGQTQDGCATSCQVEVVEQEAAPCGITGDFAMCDGGTSTFCGPEGFASYQWTGPEGFTADGRCVTTPLFGSYELTVTTEDGCMSSCSWEVGYIDIFEPCEITGELEIGPGGSTQLCGPEGALAYAWEGPGEFTSDASCIEVDEPGEYTLFIDLGRGCTNQCTVEVNRRVEPGPSCPQPEEFWGQQCFKVPVDFTVQEFSDLAKCVDASSDLLEWEDGTEIDAFCAALNPPAPIDLFAELERQYVTLLANLCAGEMGLTTFEGQPIKLDPEAVTTCGKGLTVAQVLEEVEGFLTPAKRGGEDPLEQLVICLISINDGSGLQETCDPEDLGEAGVGGGGGTTPGGFNSNLERRLSLSPNPFARETVVSFAIPSDGMVEIAIYDVAGRRVRQLVQASHAAGTYRVQWDGRNDRGAQMPRGVYYVRGLIAGQQRTARVLYLK